VIWASFQEEVSTTCEGIANTIYVPDSSWTVGRNTLYAKARALQQKQGWRAEYYVFTDDDVELFTANGDPYDLFHASLVNVQPAVASVGYLKGHHHHKKGHHHHKKKGGIVGDRNVCGPIAPCAPDIDAAVNAFHVTAAPLLLPYDTFFDDRDWWSAQGILIELMLVSMPEHVVQFNNIYLMNFQHRPYPRGDDGGRLPPCVKPKSGGLSEVAQYLQPRVSECMRDKLGMGVIGTGINCHACEATCACMYSADCSPVAECESTFNASEPINYADVVTCKPNLNMV
jgi:hypothetical protein